MVKTGFLKGKDAKLALMMDSRDFSGLARPLRAEWRVGEDSDMSGLSSVDVERFERLIWLVRLSRMNQGTLRKSLL